jgi:hypothetical protein
MFSKSHSVGVVGMLFDHLPCPPSRMFTTRVNVYGVAFIRYDNSYACLWFRMLCIVDAFHTS